VTLRRRLGGPAAFSLPVWIVVWATSLLALILAADADVTKPGVAVDDGLAMVAMTIATAVAFLLINLLRPAGRDFSLRVSVVLAVGVALVRTAAFMPIANPGGVDTGFAAGSQALATTLATALTILVMNAVTESVVTHRRLHKELTLTLVDLRHQQLQQDALGEAIDQALLTDVLTATTPARQQVEEAPTVQSQDERLAVATALRATATGPLRSLSHRLAATEVAPSLPETRFLRVLIATVRAHPLWPRETAAASALVAGTSVIYLRREADGLDGVLTTLVLVIGTMAIQLGAVWLSLAAIVVASRRIGGIAAAALPLAVIATTAISLLRSELFQTYMASHINGRSVSFIVIVSLLVVVLVNAAMASQLSQETIIDRLHATIDATETEAQARNRELVRASRTLARYVHGTLQSRLLASALAIEQAERVGDPAGFDRALEQARDALLVPELLPPLATDLTAAIAQVTAMWQGIAKVTAQIVQPLPPVPPPCIAEICVIVEEGLANAMRHGSATMADVTIALHDDRHLAITIADDGDGPAGGSPGLGATIFDQASASPWTLMPRTDGPGAVLHVVVEIAPSVVPTAT